MGNSLILLVRKYVRDIPSPTINGTFWSNKEILSALNEAQEVFLNNALRLKAYTYLHYLLRQDLAIFNTGPLPNDYVHYANAHVGGQPGEEDQWALELAEVYLGGTALHYWWASHRAAFIVNGNIFYKSRGNPATGRLWYYGRPTPIVAGTFVNSFDNEVYNNQIVSLAGVICAMKEVQTARDYKTFRKWAMNLIANPLREDNYIFDWEHGDYKRDAVSEQNQNVSGGQ